MAVAGEGTLGCDIEMVRPQSRSVWQDLLGRDGIALADLVAGDRGEEFDVAATRVWTSAESLKKAGAAPDVPLALGSVEENGWVLFKSGRHRIASYVAPLKQENEKLALAVLKRVSNAGL
jgi:enediyne polyketide synthase